MTVLKEVIEDENEGLKKLLGESVLIFCPNYIYAGTLIGVNDRDIKLQDAKIVYETGPFDTAYKDAQNLPSNEWYINRALIESYGIGKKG